MINLSENHSISELIDNCLAKNKKKIISILNENNFSNEDCIIITRSFLIKAKKLLTLSKTFENIQKYRFNDIVSKTTYLLERKRDNQATNL